MKSFLCPSHVVGGGRGHKDDSRHVVEALNPLPPFVSLPAHIKHVELDLVHPKLRKREEGVNEFRNDTLEFRKPRTVELTLGE